MPFMWMPKAAQFHGQKHGGAKNKGKFAAKATFQKQHHGNASMSKLMQVATMLQNRKRELVVRHGHDANRKGNTHNVKSMQTKGKFMPQVKGKFATKAAKTLPKKNNISKPIAKKPETGAKGLAPDRTARQRISSARITGKLILWKGTMGWIIPSQRIAHKDAQKNGGKVYLNAGDVQPGNKMVQGSSVSFFAYTDGKGIGAEHVMAVAGSTATKFQAAAKAVMAANKLQKLNKPHVDVASRGNKMLPKKTISKPIAKKPENGAKKPAADRSARQRISSARITGKLNVWNKGAFGWIIPSQRMAHKDAQKNGGKVYLNAADVQPGHNMLQGSSVSFLAYTDGKGVGAEHVMAVAASGATKVKAAAKAVMFGKKLQKFSKR